MEVLIRGHAMIDQDEFERRVGYWFGLIMSALDENVHRLLSEGRAFTPDDLDNPSFSCAMRRATDYQAKYLPDEVLKYFLDPVLPNGYFKDRSRLEFLLQQALIQKAAQIQAEQCIERARHLY
jgi:hypothetical protein